MLMWQSEEGPAVGNSTMTWLGHMSAEITSPVTLSVSAVSLI